jgi:GNAT superfamily N-acetyltransferase
VQVESWRRAYVGILPDAFLATLSVDDREDQWRKWIGSGATTTWLVEDERILGFASTGLSRDKDALPAAAELFALYLHPDAWSRGAGRQLFEHVASDLRSKGFREVTLWVLARNERARRFYERCGMRLDGATKTEAFGATVLVEQRYFLRLTSA